MADVKAAVEAVLREEDATMSGVITDTRGDHGGTTRFGLASKYHPELRLTTFYTTMSVADALQVAILTLTALYAAPLRIADVADQALATKFLSFGVNAGDVEATEAMQRAVNAVYPDITRSGTTLAVKVDGELGELTMAAINRCMAQSLLNSFRLQMIAFYKDDCRKSPGELEFLCGWIDRALA